MLAATAATAAAFNLFACNHIGHLLIAYSTSENALKYASKHSNILREISDLMDDSGLIDRRGLSAG